MLLTDTWGARGGSDSYQRLCPDTVLVALPASDLRPPQSYRALTDATTARARGHSTCTQFDSRAILVEGTVMECALGQLKQPT